MKKIDYFKKFRVDLELDTGVWESGAEISPDFLYEIVVSAVDHASVM